MLPEGWSCKNINEIGIQVIDGDRGKNYPKDNEFQSAGSCLFLSAKNVTKAGFDFSLGQFITNEKHKLLNKGEVKVGDLVITTRGSIGHFAYYNQKKYQTMRINSGMAILRSNVNYIDPDFLYEMCRSQIIKTQIEKASFGSAQPQLTITIIKKFRIPLPPLPEQQKIAATLSTWDRAIEGTEKLLANSQQQKKALMQQLLTGKKRLPGFTGEWFHLPFKKVAELIYGKAIPEKPSAHTTVYPVYGTGGIISYSDEYLFEEPSIIIGRKGTIDTPRYVYTPFWCIDTTFYCKSIHNNDVKFLYYSTCFVKLRRYVEASGVPSLSRDTIYSIPLMLPPSLSEQKAIAAVLTSADEEITALESDLSRLRQEKKALMQQLLTGKRRVTVD